MPKHRLTSLRSPLGNLGTQLTPYSAVKRNATRRIRGRALQAIRASILATNPLCELCDAAGRVRQAVEIDHRVPLALGGSEEPSNRRPLCRECHRAETKRQFGERGGQR